ncbi:MAG: nucleotidyltransferase domain-containing protein [Leptospirillum sp.]
MTEKSMEIKRFIHSRIGEFVRKTNPALILLFGSAARGTATRESDIDLLVVLPECETNFHERAKMFWPFFHGWKGDIDLFVLTQAEWEKKQSKPNSFMRGILTDGVPLYER